MSYILRKSGTNNGLPSSTNAHKAGRAKFGTDGEYYSAQLFGLSRNHNHHRRPDLITLPDTYSPNLSLEVKSTLRGKGILVIDQLEYGFRPQQDYQESIQYYRRNANIPDQLDLCFDNGNNGNNKNNNNNNSEQEVAFYYDSLRRTDGIKSKDMKNPFDAIRLEWGNHYIVPHEFCEIVYASHFARKMNVHEPYGDITHAIEDLKQMIAQSVAQKIPVSKLRRDIPFSNGWQNLEHRMIEALVTNNYSRITTTDRKTIDDLERYYPDFGNLQPLIIEGPHHTSIYALVLNKDTELFTTQVATTVALNTPKIEELHMLRVKYRHHISSCMPIQNSNGTIKMQAVNGILNELEKKQLSKSLGTNTVDNLQALCRWEYPQ